MEADARVLAATNRVLSEEVKRGRFRLDLYHRLNQVEIRIPPLRERPEDILPLARHFLVRLGHEFRMRVPVLTQEGEKALLEYTFPGNVRELKNLLSRAMILSRGGPIGPQELGLRPQEGPLDTGIGPEAFPVAPGFDLAGAKAALERQWLQAALARHKGRISAAAQDLGVPRTTLYDLMRRHGLRADG